jgi:16S rRNA (guanine966-N2)-methyltransferase
MRIIAGLLRGKKLFTPDDAHIRPTADRAREAVFSIVISKLQQGFEALKVLDIFSGTGALGLEAASRGAEQVVFVDVDLTLTQKNAKLCGFSNLRFIKKDATKLGKSDTVFDVIFLDAPYHQNLTEPVLNILVQNGYMHKDTLVVAETANDEETSSLKAIKLIDERVYGAAKFSFYKLAD